MDALIYDRTQADLVNKTEKGYHNYTDINRIEEWCGYLAELLTSYGYVVHITTKTDWKMTDYRKASEMERIRRNIAAIENAYAIMKSTPQLPSTLNPIDIERANAIEKILYDINSLVENMERNFIFCGIANCGQNRMWQQRYRKLKYRLKKYYFRNIVPDASFENNEWRDTNNNSTYSTTEKAFGNRSLHFAVGTTIVANIEIERPIIGHKYYGRRYIKTNGNNQPADARFEVFAGDGEGLNWVYARNDGDYPEWGFNSAIYHITVINYPETTPTIIRCFNVATTADTFIDGLMIVDLTETFGEGNEPTLEWCDENIPYFEDTKEITVKEEIKE